MLNNFHRGRFVVPFFPLFIHLFVCPLPSHSANLHKHHRASLGTTVEIILQGDDEAAAGKAALQAFQEIGRIEQLMSPWIQTSDVHRINRSLEKEWVEVSPETFAVIGRAQNISELSAGAFDITVAPLVQLWRTARGKGVPPPSEEINKILSLIDFRNISTRSDGKILLRKRGMAIDLGGIAKGYAVDRAFDTLQSLGYKNVIVNAGGDVRVGGLKTDQPWSIGIQDPRASDKIMATILVSDGAIATSGDYEKFFLHRGKRYHHILSPKTGLPAEGCRSVTVLSKEGLAADALATAIFVLGPGKGYSLCQRLNAVECLIVGRQGTIMLTPGLKGRISFHP